jgi:uncharacterized membrane protein
MTSWAVAVMGFVATAQAAHADSALDAEALAIVCKHCVMCHATKPTHESFQEAQKNIVLESVADLRKLAAVIYAQTVQTKAMPLGNQTNMSDDERGALGRWFKELP